LQRPPANKFRNKSKAVNPFDGPRDSSNSTETRIDLPFLSDQPETQGPTEEEGFSSHILDHQGLFPHLHLIEIRLPKLVPFGKENGFFEVRPFDRGHGRKL